jgi:cytochrome o ubiquinol oxidase subunit 2
MPAPQYAAWIAEAKTRGPTLDTAGYTTLERQTANVAPFTYRAVRPGLFDDIVSQRLAPAPGPAATGAASVQVSPRSGARP